MKRILEINPLYKFTLQHGYINYDILVAQVINDDIDLRQQQC